MTEIIVAVIGAAGLIMNSMVLKSQVKGEKHRKDEHERMKIIIKAQKACLEGLIEVGANGPVKEALECLDAYLQEKAAC